MTRRTRHTKDTCRGLSGHPGNVSISLRMEAAQFCNNPLHSLTWLSTAAIIERLITKGHGSINKRMWSDEHTNKAFFPWIIHLKTLRLESNWSKMQIRQDSIFTPSQGVSCAGWWWLWKKGGKADLWRRTRLGQGGRRVMEGETLSWELARSSPGAPPRCVCLLRILSFYSLCRVELFTHKHQQKLNWKVFGVIYVLPIPLCTF